MSEAIALVQHPVVQALAWTLVHFLWQGTVIGVAAAVGLRVWRPAAAPTRYLIGVTLLGAMIVAPTITFAVLATEGPVAVRAAVETPPAATAPRVLPATTELIRTGAAESDAAVRPPGQLVPARSATADDRFQPVWLALILAGWLLGVIVLSVRLAGGWILVRGMTRRGVTPVAPALERLAREVAARLGLARRVVLFVSSRVAVPTVVGWVRPVVILPAAAVSGLSPAQIEAILAHELAHVRRHDYLVNLLQAVAETLLFYHPAVWWLSAQVREEREHCCDDMAVAACGDRLVYVSALAELAAYGSGHGLAVAATDGSLLARVRRILGRPHPAHEAAPAWVPVVLVGLVVLAAGTFGFASARSVERTGGAAPDVEGGQTPEPLGTSAPWYSITTALAHPRIPAPGHQGTQAPGHPGTPAPAHPPAPPAPPPPAAPPAPPAPPAPEPGQTGEGNMTWSSDTERVSVNWTGAFGLSDDEQDIAWVEEGETVTITEGRGRAMSMTFTGGANGSVTRTFRQNGVARAMDDEARRWLAATLQKTIRHTGLFAAERVERMLAAGGPEAVLAEIDRFGDDAEYAKQRYYGELFARAELTSALVTRVLERLPRDIHSDHALATVLMRLMAGRHLTDAQRVQAARAASAIGSDYEQRRVLEAAISGATLHPELVNPVLEAARQLSSDHERGSLLLELIARGGVTPETAATFVALVGDIGSSHEQGRVLTALAAVPDLPAPVVAAAAQAAAGIDSSHDRRETLTAYLARSSAGSEVAAAVIAGAAGEGGGFDRAELLQALALKGGLTDATAAAFFEAARTISSGFDLARVLKAAVSVQPASGRIVTGILHGAASIRSDFDRAELLVALARAHTLTSEQRDLYIAAAQEINSEYDQTRVLAELVRTTQKR